MEYQPRKETEKTKKGNTLRVERNCPYYRLKILKEMNKIKLSQSVKISAITTFVYFIITFIISDVNEGAVFLLQLIPIIFILFMIWGLIFPLLFFKTKFTNNIFAYILLTILFEYLLSIVPFIILDHSEISLYFEYMFDLKVFTKIILLGITFGTLFWITEKRKNNIKQS